MSQRFSYVKYDVRATAKQEVLKQVFETLENHLDAVLPEGRAKSLVMTHLEIAYMWTGKAIRDEQLALDSQPERVPARSNE